MSRSDKAGEEFQELLKVIKSNNHHPRLEEASVVLCFDDSKPFKKDRFNFGKVSKFPTAAKPFKGEHYNFIITVPYAGWELFDSEQRKAWLDLHLETCQAEYLPEVVIENKKKKVVTDEHGRKVYTNEMKRDDDGLPVWKKVPIDLPTFTANVKRFGLWCDDLVEIAGVVKPNGN